MSTCRTLLFSLVAILFACLACEKDKNTEPDHNPIAGKITAIVAGLTGQTGNVYAVGVYDSDWFPGSTSPVIAGLMVPINSDDFSLSEILHAADSQAPGGYSTEDKVFEPRTYSVVFFVAVPGNPPQHFAEKRVTVDGDVSVTAPTWSQWTHP